MPLPMQNKGEKWNVKLRPIKIDVTALMNHVPEKVYVASAFIITNHMTSFPPVIFRMMLKKPTTAVSRILLKHEDDRIHVLFLKQSKVSKMSSRNFAEQNIQDIFLYYRFPLAHPYGYRRE